MTTFTTGGPRSMPRAEYDAIDAVHFSVLKEMRKSALHYRHRELHPLDETPAMLLGRGAHTAILEPLQFMLEYVLWENGDRRGKAWKEFEAAHASKTILKKNEYDLCVAMSEAVRAHPEASKYFARGRAEQVITWYDEPTGLPCKARADWICDVPGNAALVDVKSTSSVDDRLFSSLAARMGYHTQLAMYARGLRALGMVMPAKIIAVESKPPHDVVVLSVEGDALTAGDEEVGELLLKVAECRTSGQWPGRAPGEQLLTLPAWMFPDDDVAGLGIVFGSDEEAA